MAAATGENGGDGRIVMTATKSGSSGTGARVTPTISEGKIIVTYTGVAEDYKVGYDANLLFKMWGGGGAGSIWAGGQDMDTRGGAGGYLSGLLPVKAGDVIEFRVGQGGRGGNSNAGSRTGGLGGWPDGGSGSTQGHPVYMGGGGGSTSLYKNGVLMAIVGAGGGAGLGTTGTNGGGGGGLTGVNGAAVAFNHTTANNNDNYRGGGGTQTAGGGNTQQPTYAGAALKGGNAFNASLGQTAASSLNPGCGAGGGGGYYGGAGSSTTNGWPAGAGGGSSWTHSSITNVVNTAATPPPGTSGVNSVPLAANNTDSDFIPGVGQGARSGTAATGDNGGDGRAILIAPKAPPPAITLYQGSTETASYSGTKQTVNIAQDGNLTIKLWGGGGSGGKQNPTVANIFGGGGGYTTSKFPVVVGDLIEVEVGQGGQMPVTDGVAAIGGWPDGGKGGSYAPNAYHNGSGGGSTRVYKNGTLILVAGGGGGTGANFPGGAGGGLTGGKGSDVASPPPSQAGGGTQTAGGSSASPLVAAGYLRGGDSKNTTGSVEPNAGAGGGGGYYGGGAGTAANQGGTGGGGGSSYINPIVPGSTMLGLGRNPMGSPAAGIGLGGVGAQVSYATVTSGGDGQAIFSLAAAPAPTPIVKNTPTNAVFTGEAQTFVAQADGALTLELWGGGGGGGYSTGNTGTPGGAGGYTQTKINVVTGDLIKVEVGSGGKAPVSLMATDGGWPDGGGGGYFSTSYAGGSGGGSTRVYKNGTLIAVAGAGGGGMNRAGGAGGGRNGGSGQQSQVATPGSQFSGGEVLASGVATPAGSFRGATSINATSEANGGGGGGYYGGGTGGNGVYGGGSGGSGYIQPGLPGVSRQAPNRPTANLPAPTVVEPPVAGVAQGGQGGTSTFANVKNGGDGLVRLSLADTVTPSLPMGKTVLGFTGEKTRYNITEGALLNVKLWGGGGGGSNWFNGNPRTVNGGVGGSVFAKVAVQPGDYIEVEVAQGAEGASYGIGGPGGWPDGGHGGTWAKTTSDGGGGGSTRLYKNGVLIAVAGGGGGASYDAGYNGGGAGLTGGAGSGGNPNATGGTQTAAGTNTGDTARNGDALKGGNGFTTGADRNNGGGGGGGGYYGGAGGRNYGGGGGGSSWASPSLSGVSISNAVAGITPVTSTDEDYGANAARGASANTVDAGPGLSGGDGRAVLNLQPGESIPATFNVTSLPVITVSPMAATGVGASAGNASGALTTITMTPPSATPGTGGAFSTPLPGPVVMSAPQGTVSVGFIVTAMPVIQVTGELGGRPQFEAVVVVAVADYDVTFEAPEAEVVAAVNYDVKDIPRVVMTAPRYILGAGAELYDPIIFAVTPPQGDGKIVPLYDLVIDSVIQIDPPVGSAETGANFIVGNPLAPENPWARVNLFAPDGTMRGPDETAEVDFGTPVQVTGFGAEVFFPVLYSANATAPILIEAPQAAAEGSVNVRVPESIQATFFARIANTPPAAEPAASVNVDAYDVGLVVMGQPQARFVGLAEAYIYSMPTLRIIAPRAVAFEGVGRAVDGDLTDASVLILAPQGLASGDNATAGYPGQVFILPPEAFVVPIPGTHGAITLKRSDAKGAVPATLATREPAWNTADGVLFLGDGQRSPIARRLGDMGLGGIVPSGGSTGDVLYADGVWRAPAPAFVGPIKSSPQPGRRALSDVGLGPAEIRPTLNTIHYRPFYIPRQTEIVRLGVTVATGGGAISTAHLGLCGWDIDAKAPTALLGQGDVAISGAGDYLTTVAKTLSPGWYAAAFAIEGQSPLLIATVAPSSIKADFTAEGDPIAAYAGTLNPPPPPTGVSSNAFAYVWAEIA